MIAYRYSFGLVPMPWLGNEARLYVDVTPSPLRSDYSRLRPCIPSKIMQCICVQRGVPMYLRTCSVSTMQNYGPYSCPESLMNQYNNNYPRGITVYSTCTLGGLAALSCLVVLYYPWSH